MTGSFRKTLVRALLERVIKPMARPGSSLSFQRSMLDRAAFTMRSPRGVKTTDTRLGNTATRKIVPLTAQETRHVLYLHGGAYVEGSIRSHTALAAQVGHAAHAVTWLIDYRLAPEHPHPAALEDAVSAYRALLAQGIAAQNIAIAGDSAGGGLTLAAAIAIRDTALPQPAALVLLSPWTDLTMSGASLQTKANVEPMLNVDWLDWAAGLYCGAEAEGKSTLRTDPGVSPLFADLQQLPPLLVHVGSDEILLDDATCLAERAAHAGVDVTLRVFEGLWHVFQAQAGMIAEADESVAEIGEFIRRHMPG